MNKNSRVFVLLVVAALSGGLLATWIAPRTIAWYFEPPVEIGVNCRPAVEWSMNALLRAQLVGMIVGFLIGLGILWWKLRRPSPGTPSSDPPRSGF